MRYYKAKKLIFVSENSKTLLKLIKNNLSSKSVYVKVNIFALFRGKYLKK